MKAFLLAAGLGTRLRPITEEIPKCLVPINGKPLLEYWLESIFSSGIKECLINTHYLSEKVADYIATSKYKKRITVVYEKKLIGTAGSLKKNIEFFENSTGLLIYADNFTTYNLTNFIENSSLMPKECVMSMLTFECEDPSQAGIVKLNNENVMIDFKEKPSKSKSKLANAGVFFMTAEFINYIKFLNEYIFDFSIDIIPNFKNKIFCIQTKDIFYDIGTLKNYKLVNSILEKNFADSKM